MITRAQTATSGAESKQKRHVIASTTVRYRFGDFFSFYSHLFKHEYCQGTPGHRAALTVLMLVTPRGPWPQPK